MTPTEAVGLCRLVKAICPAQAMDEYTPDAWHDLLVDLDPLVARDAVRTLGQTQRFIAPADVIAEVARKRREILAGVTSETEPEWLQRLEGEEHTREYLRWRRDRQNRLLRGEPEPLEPPRQIVNRDLSQLRAQIEGVAKNAGAKRTELPDQKD